MGKYRKAQDEIFSVLASTAWSAENIKSFPSGYDGDKGEPPFVRFTVVPGGVPINAGSISGVLQVEIFTAWGQGPAPASDIADTLDKHLQRRTIGTTQLFNSSMDGQVRDRDNPGLARTLYSLPFSHFGVNE